MLLNRLAAVVRSGRLVSRTPLVARAAPTVLGRVAPTNFIRFASNSNSDDFDLSDKDMIKVQEMVAKLNQHPEIRDILDQFQKLLLAKGFNPNQPPSFMEMMRLLSQKDVRELASKMKDKFEEAGVKFSPEDMGLFMKLFKK